MAAAGSSAVPSAPPAPPGAATDASTHTFVRAGHVVFGEWTCLKLAVENEWGGGQTRVRALALLKRVLDGLLASSTVHRDELEDVLEIALLDDFNIESEDDSPKQVALVLLTLHAEAKVGATTTADLLLARAATKGSSWVECPPPPKAQADSSDDEDCDDDDDDGGGGGGSMMTDVSEMTDEERAARNAPVVDDDGFQMVPNRRGRGKS